MQRWGYRVVRDRNTYTIQEVVYGSNGSITCILDVVFPPCSSREQVVEAVQQMLKDITGQRTLVLKEKQ